MWKNIPVNVWLHSPSSTVWKIWLKAYFVKKLTIFPLSGNTISLQKGLYLNPPWFIIPKAQRTEKTKKIANSPLPNTHTHTRHAQQST